MVTRIWRLGLVPALRASSASTVRIASRSGLVCGFRFDDELIWGLLTDSHAPRMAQAPEANADRLHASVLMAGRYAGGATSLAA